MPNPMQDGQKVKSFTLKHLTSSSPDFYPLVGPFLSKREIVEELGSPVWDDPGKNWVIAVDQESGKAIGMIAVLKDTVCSFYVEPMHRGKVVGASLLMQLVTHWPNCRKAIVTDAGLAGFTAVGFQEKGTRGRFHVMERNA